MNNKNNGFTLAELLIVVAIIGVLVAISIPIFSSQLEKSREATDLANVRAAYAEVMAAANVDDTNSPYYDTLTKEYKTIVYLKQKKNGWSTTGILNIGGVSSDDSAHWKGDVKAEGRCEVAYSTTYQDVILTWDGLTLRVNYQWKIDPNSNTLSMSAGSYNNSSWPCNAITDSLSATNGDAQKLTTAAITDASPKLKQGINDGYEYQIGYFIVDADNNIIVDSGRHSFDTTKKVYSLKVSDYKGQKTPYDNKDAYTYQKNDLEEGAPIKVAVQVFKVSNNGNGTAKQLSLEEARELERLISIVEGDGSGE